MQNKISNQISLEAMKRHIANISLFIRKDKVDENEMNLQN